MSEINQELPYQVLGARLRRMREAQSESVAEVAGSVEVDLAVIDEIEQGKARPAEDILLLLISHFSVKEEEATKLWELAGYEKLDGLGDDNPLKNTVMVMPVDARIIYTDMAHVAANQHGLVLNFMQTNGPTNQPMIVSRLGMSREHAKSMVELLQQALSGTDNARPQQALPAPKKSENSKESSEQ